MDLRERGGVRDWNERKEGKMQSGVYYERGILKKGIPFFLQGPENISIPLLI